MFWSMTAQNILVKCNLCLLFDVQAQLETQLRAKPLLHLCMIGMRARVGCYSASNASIISSSSHEPMCCISHRSQRVGPSAEVRAAAHTMLTSSVLRQRALRGLLQI